MSDSDRLVPPPPSSLVAQRTMEANRRTNTRPERQLRSQLHARGLRFRKDHRIVLEGHAVRPDIVFTLAKVAVFVDGCFWHQCPVHATQPKANEDFWSEKFRRTRMRDRRNNAALLEAGWTVVRIWEHEAAPAAADRVEAALEARINRGG